jgi:hypothetical protein
VKHAWLTRRLLLGALLATTSAAASDRDDEPDPVAFSAALEDARVTLEAGLFASEQRGKPVSAKFDIADGDLQLTVCIATIGGLQQVVVDPNTATIVWSEPITEPDDLADATAQKIAIERAGTSLLSAVTQVLRDNKEGRAVDVTPVLQDGHPVAVVTLLVNGKFIKVSRWLE